MNIEDLGLEVKRNPISKVRYSFHEGKWFVEYKLKEPRYYFDKWLWYTDGKYRNYVDARTRAEFLANNGYFETVQKKSQTYDVKGE
mgnify:CR=1 FL=1